jgi:DNA-binding NtrC family response regulator
MDAQITVESVSDELLSPTVESEALRNVYRRAEPAALHPVHMLIRGEGGVGKRTLARWIHARSSRAQRPFASVRCDSSNMSLEKAFFGREAPPPKGHVGLLETANGGTVFLAEVCGLELGTQAQLLRAIETGKVQRVGAVRARPFEARFIAATERDLDVLFTHGFFRGDFFFKLNGFALTIPPLRERPDDIEPLARHFLSTMSAGAPPRLSKKIADRLRSFAWPGNAHQLRSVIERAFRLCKGSELAAEHFDLETLSQDRLPALSDGVIVPGGDVASVDPDGRDKWIRLLEEHGGDVTVVGKTMGVGRDFILRKLDRYRIRRPAPTAEELALRPWLR